MAALFALVLGLWLVGGGGGATAGQAEAAVQNAALLGLADAAPGASATLFEAPERAAPPVPRPVPAAERAARERTLEGIVARHLAEADRRSQGKANARNVTVAVHAVEIPGGRSGLLASRRSDEPLVPASNAKLVTAAAALVLLTPAYAFETRVEAGGPIAAGVLEGDLVVRAGADPLTDAEGTGEVEPRFDALAREIAARGVRRVRGALVLDEGSFAAPVPAPGWPPAAQHWADYCALPAGLTVNAGVLRATLAPGGGAPRVIVHPAPHGLRESYGVRIGVKHDVRVGATQSACTVKGEIPAARVAGWSASFAHPDPVQLFGSVLAEALRRAGIEVQGGVERRRGTPAGRPLASLSSPLVDALVPINTHSANGVAEQVFLALGAEIAGEGSRLGGERAARLALERLGIPTDGYAQADGSGLSRDTRVTARQLVLLLEAVCRLDARTREAYFDSLAVAGRTGTLEHRLRGTPGEGRVFAKTGWIEGASALSGRLLGEDGREVLFSILVAYPRGVGGLNTHVFKPLQDEIVLSLCEDPR